MKVKLKLRYPISANRYWRHCCGKVYVTQEAKAYKDHVKSCCHEAGIIPIKGKVCLTLNLYPKDKRCIDLDNSIKITQDALQHYAYENDSQVEEIHAYKHHPDNNGARLEVLIEDI